jgi:cytochrome c-type biogenesis protein CcmH/NrfF
VLPLAHVGHYLWVLYLVPVAIVVAGIVKSTRAQRRRDR